MKKFLSIFKKDSLVLIRDWPALTILFIMPAILLIIITLTQEGALMSEKSDAKLIIVNADSSFLGNTIINDLDKSGSFNFTCYSSAIEAEIDVLKGIFQFAVVIPDSATERLIGLLKENEDTNILTNQISTSNGAGINIIYDPAVQTIYKNATVLPLKMVIQLSAMKVMMANYTDNVKISINEQFSNYKKNLAEKDFSNAFPDFPNKKDVMQKIKEELNKNNREPEIKLPVNPVSFSDLVQLNEYAAKNKISEFKPNPLQNNIPAFTLFAMFFIVIPLAGSIINEKNQGTYTRMRTLPVSNFNVVFSKITVFIIICILQFAFLMFIGTNIMPMLGNLPSLNLHVSYFALSMVLIASSLAATGFGILVGTISDTHGQAATFGSVMVVILAMLGGIFVPAYMMPDIVKTISMVSPLRWGTDAFLEVFARNEGFGRIWSEILLLIGFFSISLTISVKILNSRK